MTCAIEDAGFEIRDCLMYMYGCLSEDTSPVTPNGIVPYSSIRVDDPILCYNPSDHTYGFQPVEAVYEYDIDEDVFHLDSESTHQIVSRNHRCILELGGAETFVFAEQAARQPEVRVPVLEDLSGLLHTLRSRHQGTGNSQQDVQQNLHESEPQSTTHGKHYPDGATKAEVDNLCGVFQGSVEADLLPNEGSRSNLLPTLQRGTQGQGTYTSLAQRQSGVDGNQPGKLPGEDDREQQSSVEGRVTVQAAPREVGSVPVTIHQHGETRWMGSSTSVGGGTGVKQTSNIGGGSTPHQPQLSGQSSDKPDAVRVECRPFTASRWVGHHTSLVTISRHHYTGKIWCVKVPTGSFVAVRNGLAFATGNSGFPKSKSCLKPSYEPIVLARKPGKPVLPLNIDACRIGDSGGCRAGVLAPEDKRDSVSCYGDGLNTGWSPVVEGLGRWPTNTILDEGFEGEPWSRYFYTAKASRAERDAGLDAFPALARPTLGSGIGGQPDQQRANNRNTHPTVKPLSLTEHLAKLILPNPSPDTQRRLLVPFSGSGSEMIGGMLAGWDEVTGIELQPEYVEIAQARLRHWEKQRS
jgi:hypothetical protein